jgi:hypothetical protein
MTRRANPPQRPQHTPLEHKLAELRALDVGAAGAIYELRTALRSSTGILVASAAKIVADHRIESLIEELAPAFVRLLEDAVKRDPGCRGKTAIVKALHALDHWEDRVFVAGLRHVQPEGWGADDTAAELRGLCGLAHAQFARDDALSVLATLLADSERVTRAGAARGLGDAGRPDASALLRYKLLVDDPDAEVTAACVESLLSLARDSSYDFLIDLLEAHDERAEVVALALGGERIARAFKPLVAWCIGCKTEQRHRVGYLAIALLRMEPANEYLLDAIRSHARPAAVSAARALATFKDDVALARRIRDAAREHKDPTLHREVDELLER